MNRPIRNPHLVASDRRIACQFYDQSETRPLSHKPATFVPYVKPSTPSIEDMKALARNMSRSAAR